MNGSRARLCHQTPVYPQEPQAMWQEPLHKGLYQRCERTAAIKLRRLGRTP